MKIIKLKYFQHLWRAFVGNCYKLKVWSYMLLCISPYKTRHIEKGVLVSLTSYGRRVADSTPYAIFSLMNQTYRAEKIVLCLNQDKWNEENLPFLIKRLKHYGLEILYCKDVRSYTKLIPAMLKYPEYALVTIDDDVYYSKHLMETLCSCYYQNKNCIYTVRAYLIPTNEQREIAPYHSWLPISGTHMQSKNIFPLGCGGVLYPPHSLHEDFDKENLYMSLCPLADDIWFYFMAKLKGTQHRYVYNDGCIGYPIDFIWQNLNRDALRYQNVSLDKNDEQINAIIKYYNNKTSML